MAKIRTVFWNKEPRESYFKIIEDKLKNNSNFKYTRIQQVPSNYDDAGNLSEHFGTAASNHVKKILPMIRDNENIKLQYVKGGEITGFLIFDDSIFVRFINAIASEGRKVSVGISIQENLTSDTIKDFCKRYCTMISDNYLPKKIKEDML